jgi:prepilin-type N-terminal cleavage/methylation domain-containing protein
LSKTVIRRQTGFTLVELIIVLSMIGILSSFALPKIFAYVERSKITVDTGNLRTLNLATNAYRLGAPDPDPFQVTSNTDDQLMQVLINEEYLTDIFETKVEGTSFNWDFENLLWVYGEGQIVEPEDPIWSAFINAIQNSPLSAAAFLAKTQTWKGYSGSYQPNYWNGYLEKILERGDVASNKRDPSYEGTNTIGYTNPYSDKATVVNYNKWDDIKNGYPDKVPPAILITNQDHFDPTATDPYITNNIESLKGTMVFYKNNATQNSQTAVYYINEDGSLSDLRTIETVLP